MMRGGVSLKLVIMSMITLVQSSSSNTAVTLCNGVLNSTVVFAPATPSFTSTTCFKHLAFGACCEVFVSLPFTFGGANIDPGFPSAPGTVDYSFPFTATISRVESPRRPSLRAWVPLFRDRARNYGFLVDSEQGRGGGARWVAPSSHFKDEVNDSTCRILASTPQSHPTTHFAKPH